MAQRYLGIGNGKDGVVALGSYTPLKYTCSGTSGASSLTATGTFAAGDRLFIIQSRGTGVGAYEDNRVASYATGTVTLVHPLENTYTDSGASQAQVLIVKEASEVTGSLTVDAWDGDDGGVFAIACSGTFSGTVTASGKGYRGGAVPGGYTRGASGEGTSGASVANTATANGNSGGGGGQNTANPYCGDGGSGGHASSGTTSGGPTGYPGYGGASVGQATLTSLYFGGAGGSGGTTYDANIGGVGGASGGIIVVYSGSIISSASLVSNGGNGGNGGSGGGGGAGGAGGSILVKSKTVDVSGTITASAGTGGTSGYVYSSGGRAPSGSVGRIRIESCSVSGTTSPSASESTGGHDYCGGGIFII
jgi:hypothetical protein